MARDVRERVPFEVKCRYLLEQQAAKAKLKAAIRYAEKEGIVFKLLDSIDAVKGELMCLAS